MLLKEITGSPSDLKGRLRLLVKAELTRAEAIWADVGDELVVKAEGLKLHAFHDFVETETNIPGYPTIDASKPPVDNFIAFVVDMRQSTKHLLNHIAGPKVSCLQRIFYETSALLPAIAEVVRTNNGRVTEYLGDGVLALFRATKDIDVKHEACRSAYRAACSVVGEMRDIINDELDSRYDLPAIDLGVGMAYSRAVVTVVGHPQERAPKAFGSCVYRATKLAGLKNRIAADDQLKEVWPTSKGGLVSFESHNFGDIPGFILPTNS